MNSPRSLEACRQLGINPQSLYFVKYKTYLKTNPEIIRLNDELKKKRFENINSYREEMIELVKQKREEIIKGEKEKLEKLLNNKEELKRKIKEEEEERIIEEEGRKEINQLSSGLNKEQQLLKSSEKGYIFAVKKLLKKGVNINAKDIGKRRRDKEIQH